MSKPHPLVLMLATVTTAACYRSPVDPAVPELELSPTFLRFTARPNEVVTPVPVSVVGATPEAYAFRATADAPWIVVLPSAGTTPAVISVSVVTTGVPLGTSQGTIHFEMLSETAGATGASLTVELELSSPGWSSLAGPDGATTVSLAVDPDDPSIVLAGTRRGAILRSVDGGASFTRQPTPFAGDETVQEIQLTTGGRGYVATQRSGVWRTDDHGASWQPTGLQNTDIESVAIDPANPDRLCAQYAESFCSTDGGTSFQTTPSANPWFIHPDPTGVSSFILGGDDGWLYRGDGSAFTALVSFGPWPVTDFAVTPSGRWLLMSYGNDNSSCQATLEASDDDGLTWTRVGTGMPGGDAGTFRMWPVGATLYVSSQYGLGRSVDEGETFTFLPPPAALASGDGPFITTVAATSDGLLASFHGDGIFHLSADGTWQRARQLDLSIEQLVYVPATGGLVVRTDNASLYRYLPGSGFTGIGGTGLHFEQFYNLGALSVDPRNSAVIWIGGYCSGLHRTLDGGQTWEESNNGADLCVWGLTRSPTNPDVLWVGSEGGIFRSTDNGLSFQQVNSRGAACAGVVSDDLAFMESGGNLLRVDSGGTVATAYDGSSGCGIWWVRRTEDGALWTYGPSPGLRRSDDDGLTFTELGLINSDVDDVVVDPGAPSHVFIATANGVSESRDQGASFTDVGCPFPAWSLALDTAGHRLFVGTELGGVYVYAYTP